MENTLEIGVLGTLILAATQILLSIFPKLKGQVATLIATVVLGAIALLVRDGLTYIELGLALLAQVFVYDFAVKPLKQPKKSNGYY